MPALRVTPFAAALLALGCVSGAPAPERPRALEPSVEAPPLTPERAHARLLEQLALLQQLSAPSEHHARLRPLAGAWSVELEAAAPDGSFWRQARGEARLEWILEGRFLRWESSLGFEAADPSGARSTRTFGLLGYAKEAEEYQLLMVSDLVSALVISRGRGDLEREGLSLRPSSLEEPRVGARRGVLRLLDRDRFVLEEHELGAGGRERLVQRATYRRVDGTSP